jgi:colanic acid/amylovoran biosynthesis glycosyltransferase
MEESHCFIHHSVTDSEGNTEGLPTVLMEAMSMELPVISTRHSGIPELVSHNKHGILVNERDVESLKQAMETALQWKYKPENREHVVKNFSAVTQNALLLDYFQSIVREKTR